jgi:hypothetical protein
MDEAGDMSITEERFVAYFVKVFVSDLSQKIGLTFKM